MPVFDTATEIVEAVKKKFEHLSETRLQMQADFNMIHLIDAGFTPKSPKFHKYISSAPRNFFDKVTDGTNRAILGIAIKLPENAPPEDKEAANDGELFIFGVLNEIDQDFQNRGEPPLRQGAAWHEGARGWVAVRLIVHVPKGKKEVKFDCELWDVMHTAWEVAADGLVWAAYERWLNKAQISAEFGEDAATPVTENGVQVIDFWDREGNSVVIDGNFHEGKENKKHGLDHVPVYIGAVGSMPTILSKDAQTDSNQGLTTKFRGSSVMAPWRGTVGEKNRGISFLLDVADRAREAPLVHESKDGVATIKGDPYGEFTIIPLKIGDKLYYIDLPTVPPELPASLAAIERDQQESTFPQPLGHGGTEAPESGRALSIRIDQTRSVFTPRTEGLARLYKWLCSEIIHQVKTPGRGIGRKEMTLSGFNSRDEFFRITKRAGDLNENWFFDIRVEPRLPRDEAEEMLRAIQATTLGDSGEPLNAHETAREDILKMRNPKAEADKITLEQALRLPTVRTTKMAAALTEAGEEEAAQQVVAVAIAEGVMVALPEEESEEDPEEAPDATNDAGAAPAGAPPGGTPQEALTAVVEEILRALTEAGEDAEIARPVIDALQAGQIPTPEILKPLIEALITINRQDLADTLLQLLQQLDGGQAQPASATTA